MNTLSPISDDTELRRLFGRFPTGVTALCAVDQGSPVGMTASAFVAISLNPPLVSVCIKHGSGTWRQLRTCERVGISFLGNGHAATARQLAQKTGDRFLGLDYEASADGALPCQRGGLAGMRVREGNRRRRSRHRPLPPPPGSGRRRNPAVGLSLQRFSYPGADWSAASSDRERTAFLTPLVSSGGLEHRLGIAASCTCNPDIAVWEDACQSPHIH